MKHTRTINTTDLRKSTIYGGCGECQASCQTAVKTNNAVINQKCEHRK